MPPTLTIFTPTYNRAYTLSLCYESLKRQTCRDFVWLIIDDGSTDNTRDLVRGWMIEGLVPIRYSYQSNQGMHGAHNTAYDLIDTELNVCIDSDDYLADDAVGKIIRCWREHGGPPYAGLVGLDATPAGAVIGTRLPAGVPAATLGDLYARHGVKGDKKLVYRSQLTRDTPPYPLYTGEKYCPLSYKYVLIDQQAPLLLLNEVLCHVEYLADGSSRNMVNQYRKNPHGFRQFRLLAMRYAPTWRERLRESVHYVSSSVMSGQFQRLLKDSPCPVITLLSVPLGLLLYGYIRRTGRATVMPASAMSVEGDGGH